MESMLRRYLLHGRKVGRLIVKDWTNMLSRSCDLIIALVNDL